MKSSPRSRSLLLALEFAFGWALLGADVVPNARGAADAHPSVGPARGDVVPSFRSADPQLLRLDLATYLGGSGEDRAHGMAVDEQGNLCLVGPIQSTDFPTTAHAFQTVATGMYFARLDSRGAVLFSTYLGAPGGNNYVHGVAIDRHGCITIAGNTTNRNFPVTPGAFQTAFRGPDDADHGDAFVIKLSPAGDRVIYATFLGGSGLDICGRVAVDAEGCAYVLGCTSSADFPVTPGAFQTAFHGGEDEPSGRGDLFVAKLSPDGSRLLYCTYVGGTGTEIYGDNLVVDPNGAVTFAGSTTSRDFPTSPQAFQKAYRGGSGFRGGGDGLVCRISPTGTALEFASYIGGGGDDYARAVAVDPAGNLWLAGDTTSADFPTAPEAWRRESAATDCFLVQLDADAGTLRYGSLVGGSKADALGTLAWHPDGWLVLAGRTESADFPGMTGNAGAGLHGPADLFVALVDPTTKALRAGTLLGGNGSEVPGPLLTVGDSIYLAGNTTSADFPVTPDAGDATYNGGTNDWGGDVFVTRFTVTRDPSPGLSDARAGGGITPGGFDYLGQRPPGDTPEVFAPDVISTLDNEHSAPAFSPHGDEVFWFANRPPGPANAEWLAFGRTMRRVDGRWSPPAVSPFEGMLVFSPTGGRAYVASRNDLWTVDKHNARWGGPHCLEFVERFPALKAVNMPSVTANGALYFIASIPGEGGGFGIYRSELRDGAYAMPQLLPAGINQPGQLNWAPFIAPDESFLLFSSNRTGNGDLYISRRRSDGSWTDPVSLGESVNTSRQEVFPGLSPDGKYLFFCRETPGRGNDVYWVDAASVPALHALPSPPLQQSE